MPRTLKIELPLPPLGLSPNKKTHWRVLAAGVKAYRNECETLIAVAKKANGWTMPERSSALHYDFYICRNPEHAKDAATKYKVFLRDQYYLPRDPDNAIAVSKRCTDAARLAEAIRSDAAKWVTGVTATIHSTRKEHEGRFCLTLTITTED